MTNYKLLLLISIIICSVFSNPIKMNGACETVIEMNDNFRIVDITKNTPNGYEPQYRYEIYNNQGELIKSEFVEKITPDIRLIDNSLLEIIIKAGPGLFFAQYYDIQNDTFSEIFDTPLLLINEEIIYLSFNNSRYFLVVRDIFSSEKCPIVYELDLSPVANPFDAIKEIKLEDDSTVYITYLSGKGYDLKILRIEQS